MSDCDYNSDSDIDVSYVYDNTQEPSKTKTEMFWEIVYSVVKLLWIPYLITWVWSLHIYTQNLGDYPIILNAFEPAVKYAFEIIITIVYILIIYICHYRHYIHGSLLGDNEHRMAIFYVFLNIPVIMCLNIVTIVCYEKYGNIKYS